MMEKVNIQFRGVTTVPDDSVSNDGDMALMLNLRHEGGEITQCWPPKKENADIVLQAMYHPQSGMWLELVSGGELTIRDESYSIRNSGVVSFSIMGNIVIINLESSVEYAIWRGGDEGYVLLGELPNAPKIKAEKLEELNISKVTTDAYFNSYVELKASLWQRVVQKGYVDRILDTIYKKRGYVDRAWFKVGLKLFDGSYIAMSEITQISSRPEDRSDDLIGIQDLWTIHTNDGTEEIGGNVYAKYYYKAAVNYFVPQISLSFKIDNKWSDIISSIVLFSTGSIMTYAPKVESGEREDNNGDGSSSLQTQTYEWYALRSADELRDAMVNATFHKVAEYDIDGTKIWEIEDTSPSSIAVQPEAEDIQTHRLIPQKSAVINGKLHIAKIKTALSRKCSIGYVLNTQEDFISEYWETVVYLKTEYGIKKVIYKEDEQVQLPGRMYYFSYPDSRAVKIEIYEKDRMLSFPLTAHKFRNEAYYLKTITRDITIQQDNDSDKYYKDIPCIETGYEWSTGNIPAEDNTYEDLNILKVSAVDNPFYFPTAQTYKFEGNIVALASNAEAISTGQFGAYPLFVFTSEGIWTMAVDTSGKGAYTTQTPFSREVCNGNVCLVSGGVVFTTDRGVMAISGGQVTELSQQLDGAVKDVFSNGVMKSILQAVSKDKKTAPVPIRTYLKDAVLAYNYLHNEIILSNYKYTFSYVYSLTAQTWSMIDVTFDVTTNSYPELVVYNTDTVERIEFIEGDVPNSVIAITRPIKAGTLDRKRLRQAALRGLLNIDGGKVGFYVLGSNDGYNYELVTGKEYSQANVTDKYVRDMVTSMSRSRQYKFFAIAVVGNFNGRISMAELLVDMGFAGNKLR